MTTSPSDEQFDAFDRECLSLLQSTSTLRARALVLDRRVESLQLVQRHTLADAGTTTAAALVATSTDVDGHHRGDQSAASLVCSLCAEPMLSSALGASAPVARSAPPSFASTAPCTVFTLPTCGHRAHARCLERALTARSNSRSCPVCARAVDDDATAAAVALAAVERRRRRAEQREAIAWLSRE